MNKNRIGVLLGALAVVLACTGCVADGPYVGGAPGGYYAGGYASGYGPGYYGAPGPVVVAGGPVYRETVVVDNTRYRSRDGYYYNRHPRPAPVYRGRYDGSRRGGSSYTTRSRSGGVSERRTSSRRTPAPVPHRDDRKKRTY